MIKRPQDTNQLVKLMVTMWGKSKTTRTNRLAGQLAATASGCRKERHATP